MKSIDENAKSSTADNIEGHAKVIGGKIKQETGKLVRSPELEAKGNAEVNEGRVQEKIGQIKKVFGK